MSWLPFMSEHRVKLLIALLLVGFAVVSRLVPHPANVAPIAAVALFGGAVLPRKLALTLPLAAMIISDIFLGFHSLIFFTWGSFLLIALLASYRLKNPGFTSVFGMSIAASIIFYLVTNFGVWLEGRLYDQTFAGIMRSYYNALPFFRNTLLGDLLYSGLLFGAYYLAVYTMPKRIISKGVV